MIGDVLIVILSLAVVAAVVVPPIYRKITGRKSGGCCGCDKCSCKKNE